MLRCMMALEAIKLITGYGMPMLFAMPVLNAHDNEFKKLKFGRMKTAKYAGHDDKAKGVNTIMVMGILGFAIVAFFVSFLIGRINDVDKGKVAAYVTLIAWGSLLYGLYLSKGVH